MIRQTLLALGLALATLAAVDPVRAQNFDTSPPSTPASTDAPATSAGIAVGTPARGQTMAQVERQFGAPQERVDAVGQPPISRWVYADKIVYFEYDHVV
ncbi:MAG: hypothetical protein ACR2I8_04895, partial [Steroidobacteraceae bacterium]